MTPQHRLVQSLLKAYRSSGTSASKTITIQKREGYDSSHSSPNPVTIFTVPSAMQAFHIEFDNLATEGMKVLNEYSGNRYSLPETLDSSDLQKLVRNEKGNTDGVIKFDLFGGLNCHLVRRLRFIVKGSIVVSKVKVKYTTPPGEGSVILIDQCGFQWAGDRYSSGGLFFFRNDPETDRHDEWKRSCYQAYFGEDPPDDCGQPDRIDYPLWGEGGYLSKQGIRKGYKTEFLHAMRCANEQGNKVYFRFLRPTIDYLFSNTRNHTDPFLFYKLRLEGIADGMESVRQGYFPNINRLHLPRSSRDCAESFNRILKQCEKLRIAFVNDDMEHVKLDWVDESEVLVVTNSSSPHTAIGNIQEMDTTRHIRSSANTGHMIIAAESSEIEMKELNIWDAVNEPIQISKDQAKKLYIEVYKRFGEDSMQTNVLNDRDNSSESNFSGFSKFGFALQVLGFKGEDHFNEREGFIYFPTTVRDRDTLLDIIDS